MRTKGSGRIKEVVPRTELNAHIRSVKGRIQKATDPKLVAELRRLLRGARRRRNWLMRTGQWPPKPLSSLQVQKADGTWVKVADVINLSIGKDYTVDMR